MPTVARVVEAGTASECAGADGAEALLVWSGSGVSVCMLGSAARELGLEV